MTVHENTYKTHQRLNAQHRPFDEWFIGLVEGDGCFSLDKNIDTWRPGFKIALQKSDIRTLIYIQKNLRCGKLTWADHKKTMIQYRIRALDQLFKYVFPIFDKYPMVTNKSQDYAIIREAAEILSQNTSYTKGTKQKLQTLAQKLKKIRDRRKNLVSSLQDRLAAIEPFELPDQLREGLCEDLGFSIHWIVKRPWFLSLLSDLGTGAKNDKIEHFQKLCKRVSNDLSDRWVVGFLQAEGSFYVTKKAQGRLCLGFGVSQKTPFILEVLRAKLHIRSKVKERLPEKSQKRFFQLDNTNARVNRNIVKVCLNRFVGLKSLQFRIWSRHVHLRGSQKESTRFLKAQRLLRDLSKDLSKDSSKCQ